MVSTVHQTVSSTTIFQLHHFMTLIDVSSYVIYAQNPKRADFCSIWRSEDFISTHGMITSKRSTRIYSR